MTANTWPDPARPGVPLNPEKGGWHWLSGVTERPAAFEWLAHKQAWLFHRAQPEAQAMPPPAFGSWTYLGPALTPDEAAALQARADRNAAGFARVDAELGRAKFLHKREIAALQKRVAEMEGALRFYADPFKYTDIHGDDVRVPHFYSETDFGETARVALGLDEPWSLQP